MLVPLTNLVLLKASLMTDKSASARNESRGIRRHDARVLRLEADEASRLMISQQWLLCYFVIPGQTSESTR